MVKSFFNIDFNNPQVAYVLGFLWADGYISDNGYVACENKSEDMDALRDVFFTSGSWSVYKRTRGTAKETTRFTVSNKDTYITLKDLGYADKSRASPNLVLAKIPAELRHLFYRGFSDGDGSFCFTENNRSYTINGTYEQDWSDILQVFDSLQVRYNLRQYERANGHRCSIVEVSGVENVKKIGRYLYAGYQDIRLNRKYEKYQLFENKLNIQKKAVIKLDLSGAVVQQYDSLGAASLDCGTINGIAYISDCCNGKKAKYKGWKWAWVN